MSKTPKKNTATALLDAMHARAVDSKTSQSYAGRCVNDLNEIRSVCQQLLNAGPQIAQLAQPHTAMLEKHATLEERQKIANLAKMVASDVVEFRHSLDAIIAKQLGFEDRIRRGLKDDLEIIPLALGIGEEYQKWLATHEAVIHGNVAEFSDILELTVQKYKHLV